MLFNKLKYFQPSGGTNDILSDLLKHIMRGVSVVICVGGYFHAFSVGMTKIVRPQFGKLG